MQPSVVNQFITDGFIPLKNVSKDIIYHLLDMNRSNDASMTKIYDHFLQLCSFSNPNMNMLLQSASISDSSSFLNTLRDFKMLHKKTFSIELNQFDKYHNTLLWYLTVFNCYNCIEILYRSLKMQLNINNKNGLLRQTILHYAVLHGRVEDISLLLNITLPNMNVCIRDQHGNTPLCYLCENILNVSDVLLENGQYTNSIERILHLIDLIVARCPYDELLNNCYRIRNNRSQENLLLYVYHKLTSLKMAFNLKNLSYRLQSMAFANHQDHCLLTERLLENGSQYSAVLALCNTNDVNVSNILREYISYDPHELLMKSSSSLSTASLFFVLLFYTLSTNVTLLNNFLPTCQLFNDNENNHYATCHWLISNYRLHTNYISFIHMCLHYASKNVYSLKHICRYHIRYYFQSCIIDKIEQCTTLNSKYRDYIKLNELLLISSKAHNLSLITYLIKRLVRSTLYKLDDSHEYNLTEMEINDSLESSSSSLQIKKSIESMREENKYETIAKHIESNTSTDQLYDSQIHPKRLSSQSTKLSSILDEEDLFVQYENELADMKAKSQNIEALVEQFMSKN